MSDNNQIKIAPDRTLVDNPLDVQLSGFSPEENVTVRATTIDSMGITWKSQGVYKISSSGKDMKIVLQGSKEVTEYVKFEMEITIIIMGQIDVMVNKKRVQKGNLEFRVMSKMSKNHSGYHKTSVFKKSTLGNILKNFYEKFIIQEELSDREDVLFDHGKDLLDAIRKRLL